MDLISATAPFFDNLTRLPNAAQFNTHLRSAIRDTPSGVPGKFAVMIVKVNEIDEIYNRFGRLVSEEMVLKLSERIRSSVRINDVIGRLDENTFSLILFEAGTPADILRISERIQTRIAEPLSVENASTFVTSSTGTSIANSDEKAIESFLEEAAAALHSARRSGPNMSAIY
jgi:diguanylate cyclase (GGDEF)-like protein